MLYARKAFRRSFLVAAALLAAAVSQALRAEEPEVLSRLPGDAYGLVVINNVRTLSNKISNTATRVSLQLPPDLIAFATQRLGITKGFEANRSAAIVLLKPSPERLAEGYFTNQPPSILLLPTSDPKVLLEPFAPKEADAKGISESSMPTIPAEKCYTAVVDNKWVALAATREDLMSYLSRTDSFAAKASPETRKVFENNDLVIWGNVAKLGAGIEKQIDETQTEISGMLELANLANNEYPVAGALQKQIINMGFAFVKQFLRDADATMLTLRLSDSGATLGMVGDFKSASTIGKFVASQQGKTVSLRGLPAVNGPFLAAGAAHWDSASIASVMDTVTTQMLADDAIAKDPRAAEFKKAFELNRQMMSILNGTRFVALDPPAGGKGGLINGVLVMDTSDPEKFQQLQTQVLGSTLVNDSMNPDIKQTVTTVPNAVTIKGVSLMRMNMKMSLREETPDKPINPLNKYAFQMMQRIYGPDGMSAYLGNVAKKVLIVYGGDGPTLEAAVAAVQADSDGLSTNPTIAATKDQVVANPIAVAYLPITRWLTLAQAFLRPAIPGDTPPLFSPAIVNAPPVVISAGVNGSMMTSEIHLPIATVQGAQEAIRGLQRALMGGVMPIPPAGNIP